ncbi:MAG: Calx-beta domain-containing protein, partial [Mycobacterium sp.]
MYAPDEVLLAWTPSAGPIARWLTLTVAGATVLDRVGTEQMLQTGQGVIYRLEVPGGTEAALRALSRSRVVAFVEPNAWISADSVSNDPYYVSGSLWGVNSSDTPVDYGPAGTTNQYGIAAEEAWAQGATGSASVYVGVIDEGIQITHPDLAANIWTNPGEIADDGIDNDGNGYVDDIHGWDFYYEDNSVYDGDEDDHGTHVAGTIAAVGGNGTGVAGVTWNTTLIPAKFLGPSGGYTFDAVKALDYLTDLKTRYGIDLVAVNNSWGGGGYSSALHSAILRAAKADILFVAAAGNNSSDNDVTAFYPSAYSSLTATATESAASYESVVAVASITSSGALSSFSDYGATTVDIGAPGSSVVSTLPTDSYGYYSGTSMATPHVTGAVALYASQHPDMTAAELRAAILDNATPTPSLAGKTVTGGRLNLGGLFGPTGPSVSISPASVSVAEGVSGTATAQFTVSLTQASASEVTVGYGTDNGTAVAGQDYTAVSGALTFAAGETSKSITVDVLGDGVVEADETFSLSLASPSGAALGAVYAATVTIVNDDSAVVSLSPLSLIVVEGDSGTTGANFTVSLSQPTVAPVTVGYATADGTATAGVDYTAMSGTLTFAAGETSKSIAVDVLGDGVVEAGETFLLSLASPSGAVLGVDTTATATIVNDDSAVVSISPASLTVTEGNSGITSAQFAVSLSQSALTTVTVGYGTANGTATAGVDYTTAAGTLLFAAGETSKLVSVPVLGDGVVEADETFTVTLTSAAGAFLGATTATATIVNDDSAVVSISPVSLNVTEGNSGTTAAQFTVSLSQPALSTVTVGYGTANGTATAGVDYTAAAGTLSFAAGETSKSIAVDVLGDGVVEAGETFLLSLASPSGAVLGVDTTATATIANDDSAVVSISPVSLTVSEGNSGTTAAQFAVSLSQPALSTVTVGYGTA